jgi:hypothetical protein
MSKLKMMDIPFKDDETDMLDMQDFMNEIGQAALFMNHYELSEKTEISPILWKKFLTDVRVAAFINEELDMLKKTKVALMLKDVDSNKNTGQAQLLNTLLNQTKTEDKKEGPVFIYTQIPLNSAEQHAENVVMVDGIDPFEDYK